MNSQREGTETHIDVPDDLAGLKQTSVRGGAITLASQATSVIVGLVSTVVMARLLSPDEYGVLAMVVATTSFAGLFADLGLSAATIQHAKLTSAQQTNLFWLNIAVGCSLFLAVAAGAPLVARYYGRPEIIWPTIVAALVFVINGVGTQSGALLIRGMRFGWSATATTARAVVGTSTAILLAILGFSYWSLVWSQVAGATASTVILLLCADFRPGRPRSGTGARALLRFGATVTGFDLLNYLHRNLDNFLIGRHWGAAQLGYYTRAYALLMFPIINLRGPIAAVAFPAMSRLQHRPDLLRTYYLRVTSILALLSMPVATLCFVAAGPVIEVLLGPKWLPAAPMLAALAVAALVQPVSGLAGSLLLSLGRGRRYLQCGAFNTAVIIVSYFVGLQWGATGVAVSYAIANVVILYPWLAWALRDSSIALRDVAAACAFPLVLSVTAAGIASAVGPSAAEWSAPGRLSLLVSVFAAVIVAGLCLTRIGRAEALSLIGLRTYLRAQPTARS